MDNCILQNAQKLDFSSKVSNVFQNINSLPNSLVVNILVFDNSFRIVTTITTSKTFMFSFGPMSFVMHIQLIYSFCFIQTMNALKWVFIMSLI